MDPPNEVGEEREKISRYDLEPGHNSTLELVSLKKLIDGLLFHGGIRDWKWTTESARYGPLRTSIRNFPMETTWAKDGWERALELNTFLLDGILPSGDPSGLRYTPPVTYWNRVTWTSMSNQNPPTVRGLTPEIQTLVERALAIRTNQIFHDGNHRTGILTLLEGLHEMGHICTRFDPVDLYIIISNRALTDWRPTR
ncbi:hypothetical protein M427DRAFT_57439, partial [Gonapodya prolifera JEL478]